MFQLPASSLQSTFWGSLQPDWSLLGYLLAAAHDFQLSPPWPGGQCHKLMVKGRTLCANHAKQYLWREICRYAKVVHRSLTEDQDMLNW